MSQQPPVANADTRITIRHRRAFEWPTVLFITTLATFWIGAGCLSALRLPTVAYALILVTTLGAFCTFVGTGAFIIYRNPISFLRLGDDLDAGGESFGTFEIRRIVIAPDPHEDYRDERNLHRAIEIHFMPIAQHRPLHLIAIDSDADALAKWATQFDIKLEDCRSPRLPAEEVRT